MTSRPSPRSGARVRPLLILAFLASLVLPGVPVSATVLPGNLRPTLAAAPTDLEKLWHDGCFAGYAVRYPKTGCIFGNTTGRFRVALVGDSHASAWFPAVERVAKARGWRLETFVKASCEPIDMRQWALYLGREYYECKSFVDATVRRLAAHPPDLLIVTSSRIAIIPVRSVDRTMTAKISAFAREIRKMPARQKVILGDVPYSGRDIPGCLAVNRYHIEACGIAKWNSSFSYGLLERGAASLTGVPRLDIVRTGWCKTTTTCPVVVNGMVTYRDRHHLTATFSRYMGTFLNLDLRRILPNLPDGTAPTPPPTPTPSPTLAPTATPAPTSTPDPGPTATPPDPAATPTPGPTVAPSDATPTPAP